MGRPLEYFLLTIVSLTISFYKNPLHIKIKSGYPIIGVINGELGVV